MMAGQAVGLVDGAKGRAQSTVAMPTGVAVAENVERSCAAHSGGQLRSRRNKAAQWSPIASHISTISSQWHGPLPPPAASPLRPVAAGLHPIRAPRGSNAQRRLMAPRGGAGALSCLQRAAREASQGSLQGQHQAIRRRWTDRSRGAPRTHHRGDRSAALIKGAE